MDYIQQLQEAIRQTLGCKSEYFETVSVSESFKWQTVWNGGLEVFQIRGHPKAKRCYAWSHPSSESDKKTRYVAVLEIPPIDSPQAAVKAAIFDEFRKKHQREKP